MEVNEAQVSVLKFLPKNVLLPPSFFLNQELVATLIPSLANLTQFHFEAVARHLFHHAFFLYLLFMGELIGFS